MRDFGSGVAMVIPSKMPRCLLVDCRCSGYEPALQPGKRSGGGSPRARSLNDLQLVRPESPALGPGILRLVATPGCCVHRKSPGLGPGIVGLVATSAAALAGIPRPWAGDRWVGCYSRPLRAPQIPRPWAGDRSVGCYSRLLRAPQIPRPWAGDRSVGCYSRPLRAPKIPRPWAGDRWVGGGGSNQPNDPRPKAGGFRPTRRRR